MKRLFYIVVIIPLLLLAGCGGGSSSGGGGAFAGTYKGTTTLMVNIPNQAPVPLSFPTTIVISPNGVVTITGNFPDGTVAGATGTINTNKITAQAAANFSPVSGVNCSGSETWNGTVTNNTAQGTYSGSANCKSSNGTFPITITGKFNATRSLGRAPAAKMRGEGGLLQFIVGRVIE